MAQEQAKSPARGSEDKASNPLEAMTRPRDEKPADKPPADQDSPLSKRTSLAERLRAEQRKRDGGEPKREDSPKPARFTKRVRMTRRKG